MFYDFEVEFFGWEGGFYVFMFWNFGEKIKNNIFVVDMMLFELIFNFCNFVGRVYMMDLIVLVGVSDYVVCGVSVMGCWLLVVMMGWE